MFNNCRALEESAKNNSCLKDLIKDLEDSDKVFHDLEIQIYKQKTCEQQFVAKNKVFQLSIL